MSLRPGLLWYPGKVMLVKLLSLLLGSSADGYCEPRYRPEASGTVG